MKSKESNRYTLKIRVIFLALILLVTSILALRFGMDLKASGSIGKGHFVAPILANPVINLNVDHNDDVDDDDEDEEDNDYDDPDVNANRIFPASGLRLSVEYHNLDPYLIEQENLIAAMTNVVERSSMELISHHCINRVELKGFICYGILTNKSHVLIHSFVEDDKGTIAVDLLSCYGSQMLLLHDVLPMMEEEFAHYDEKIDYEKNIRWKMHIRNSPNTDLENVRNPFWDELSWRWLIRRFYLKRKVETVDTPFQRIDVFDFVDPAITNLPSYFKSLSQDGSYESLHPEYYKANRVIFLDGVTQSIEKGVEAYHEALVQPAMFAHDNPRRVAIIGGGEGATLREALKHNTVDNVTMIDIDEVMCKRSAEILYPEWNGCDDFPNSTSSCFDDPRAHILYEDALGWFIERFSEDHGHEKFDIIVMDALDPDDSVDFAKVLYRDLIFWTSIYNALSDDGVLVAQVGASTDNADGPDTTNEFITRVQLIEALEYVGFKTTHSYIESHCAFEYPWSFLIVCKSDKCDKNWHASPAEVELAIYKRIQVSKSKAPLLEYFDGATMAQYRIPHKGTEAEYCRRHPVPVECKIVESISLKNTFGVQNNVPAKEEDESISSFDAFIQVSPQTKHLLYKYYQPRVNSFLNIYLEDDYEPKAAAFYVNTGLLPTAKSSTGSKSVAQSKYALTNCYGSQENSTQNCLPLSEKSNPFNSSTIFYSPLIQRHLPFFGAYLMSIIDH